MAAEDRRMSELAPDVQPASDMTQTATPLPAPGGEASAEEREPGALAPRQHPGNSIGGASGVFPESSVDFGFGNSWTHLPVPLVSCGDGENESHHSSHHDGGELHEAGSDGGGGKAGEGLHFRDDMVVSECDAGSAPAPAAFATAGGPNNSAREDEEAALPAAAAAGGSTPSTAAPPAAANSMRSPGGGPGGLSGSHVHGAGDVNNVGRASEDMAAAEEGARHLALGEPVSLPDDIYGAARVSEYWHGVPGLSSLVSTYVYDDIWAGDGGLNPRYVSFIAAVCLHGVLVERPPLALFFSGFFGEGGCGVFFFARNRRKGKKERATLTKCLLENAPCAISQLSLVCSIPGNNGSPGSSVVLQLSTRRKELDPKTKFVEIVSTM